MSQTNEMVKLAITALEDKKGEDIRVIDIHEVSVLADYFLIASGSNGNQVQAMADNVEEELGKAGDGGQRRFQIMRNIRNQLRLHPLALHGLINLILQALRNNRHNLRKI